MNQAMIRRAGLAAMALAAGLARGVTLDECVAAARAANPDVAAAEQRVRAAEAAITQAAAAWYPMLKVSAAYALSDNPPQAFMMTLNQRTLDMRDPAFDPNNPDDTDNLRLSAAVQYRLYDGGRRGLDRAMATGGAEARGHARDAAHNALTYQVARGYYGCLQAEAFLGVQEESVKLLEENLRVAQERFRAGSVVKTDVLNLEVKLAEAREDLIRARNGRALSLAALNTALGTNLVDEARRPEPVEALPAAPPDADAAAEARNRPEYRAAEAAARVREQAVLRAKRAYRPAVNAFGSLDWDSNVSSDFEQSYTVGVAAEADLFDGHLRRGRVAAAAAEAEAARAEAEQARQQLTLDATQAALAVRDARERMEVAGKSVASAEEALRITRERYQSGAADITELLTAQVGLTATRTRTVTARYDYLTARSNLERAGGRLVPMEENR